MPALSPSQISTISQWQTLIAGGLSAIAAIFGGVLLLIQITAEDRRTKELRKRQLRAARALLPVAAAEVIEYLEACSKRLWEARELMMWGKHPLLQVPDLAPTSLTRLERFIEHSDERRSRAAAFLLENLQIQRARLKGFFEELSDPQNLTTDDEAARRMLDAGETYAYANRLFRYGRRATSKLEVGPLLMREVSQPLAVMNVNDATWPEAYEELVRRGYPTEQPSRFSRLRRSLARLIAT